jgi:hypothetical protein
MRLYVLLSALAIIASVSPAAAKSLSDNHLSISALAMESVTVEALATVPEAVGEAPAVRTVPIVPIVPAVPVVAAPAQAGGSSRALPLLYAGMIALQAMDLASTHKALSVPGAYEANPLFGSVGGSLPAQIALKAGATAGIIYLTERLKKTNRVGAIITMVALNSAYATVAAHNFAIAGRPGTR